MESKDSPVIPVRINVYDVSSFIFLSIFCWLEVHGVFLVLIYFLWCYFQDKILKDTSCFSFAAWGCGRVCLYNIYHQLIDFFFLSCPLFCFSPVSKGYVTYSHHWIHFWFCLAWHSCLCECESIPALKCSRFTKFYAIATEKLLDLNCTAHWTSIENHTGTSANMGIKVDLHVLGPKMRAVLVHLVLFFTIFLLGIICVNNSGKDLFSCSVSPILILRAIKATVWWMTELIHKSKHVQNSSFKG